MHVLWQKKGLTRCAVYQDGLLCLDGTIVGPDCVGVLVVVTALDTELKKLERAGYKYRISRIGPSLKDSFAVRCWSRLIDAEDARTKELGRDAFWPLDLSISDLKLPPNGD